MKTAGQIGYEAYGDSCLPTPWRTWDNKPMPTWAELTPEIQRRWECAAVAIQNTNRECVPDQSGRTLLPGEVFCSQPSE